ncbi:MAG: hypothetical protein E7013_03845 [Alphaproteobacteria bacterium]|nr:hypothetical protein [Alphaproteobacteria bacterium]
MKNKWIICFNLFLSLFAFSAKAQETQSLTFGENILVCQQGKCLTANGFVGRHFLSMKLAGLFKENVGQTITFCEANTDDYKCLSNEIEADVKIGASNAILKLPSAHLIDTKSMQNKAEQKFVFEYLMDVSGTYPVCQATLNTLLVSALDVSIQTNGFRCDFTNSGQSSVKLDYNVNYIDLDRGILGADYMLSLHGNSTGEKKGYTLLHFPKVAANFSDLMKSCDCLCDETQKPICRCSDDELIIEEVEENTFVEERPVPREYSPVLQIEENLVVLSDVEEAVFTESDALPEKPKSISVIQELEALEQNSSSEKYQNMEDIGPLPVVEDVTVVTTTQILKPGVPVVADLEEDVAPGQVRAVSNWEK